MIRNMLILLITILVSCSPEKPEDTTETLSPKDFIFVEGGTFLMGSEKGRDNEKPVHKVNIESFYISKYEVTFDEYDNFCNENGSIIIRPNDHGWGRKNRPAIEVSWFDAIRYCNWKSKKEGLTPCYNEPKPLRVECDFGANGYRLPTEAEWEYAARGGRFSKEYTYSGSNNPDEVAWYDKNSQSKTHPVGQKKPNELSLYDMSGNVREWCWDRWSSKDNYYKTSPLNNPRGPEDKNIGKNRMLRGGCFFDEASDIRYTHRRPLNASVQFRIMGFRLVRTTLNMSHW